MRASKPGGFRARIVGDTAGVVGTPAAAARVGRVLELVAGCGAAMPMTSRQSPVSSDLLRMLPRLKGVGGYRSVQVFPSLSWAVRMDVGCQRGPLPVGTVGAPNLEVSSRMPAISMNACPAEANTVIHRPGPGSP